MAEELTKPGNIPNSGTLSLPIYFSRKNAAQRQPRRFYLYLRSISCLSIASTSPSACWRVPDREHSPFDKLQADAPAFCKRWASPPFPSTASLNSTGRAAFRRWKPDKEFRCLA